jgi:hypothetical protein
MSRYQRASILTEHSPDAVQGVVTQPRPMPLAHSNKKHMIVERPRAFHAGPSWCVAYYREWIRMHKTPAVGAWRIQPRSLERDRN